MQVLRNGRDFSIVLFQPERFFLLGILADVLRNYTRPPDELDPRVRRVWYSPDTADTAAPGAEDREHWMESLQEFRSGNARLCRRWLATLQDSAEEPVTLTVLPEELDTLLILLNDHRLYQAALHEVGEKEMELDLDRLPETARRQALLEIHFLAALIEMLLAVQEG